MLFRQVNSPIIYLLLGASALAVLLGKGLDGAVVLGAVLVNVVIGFLQEFRAGQAIEALSKMVPHEATVIRGGHEQTVHSSALVPGDMLRLSSGNRVPADVRLLSLRNLQVDESALTGESVPSHKAVFPLPEETPIADRSCIGFSGTLVTSGVATGVVFATGKATELGRISTLIASTTELQTPLTRAIARVGKSLTLGVLGISVVLFVVGQLRGYSVADGLLVALTLAVAVIPEGLPAIITIALAVGVQRMARRRAVIRKLPVVETLGSTTIICSDKTGTLTRNEMTVQDVAIASGDFTFSGIGYAPVGEVRGPDGSNDPPPALRELLEAAALCSDATVYREDEQWKLSGDPTEAALMVAAMKAGVDLTETRARWPRLDAIPFESEQQFMATLHRDPRGATVVVPQGGSRRSSAASASPRAAGRTSPARLAVLTGRGRRLLAVARKPLPPDHTELELEDVDGGFELLGLEGMSDPPRDEAIASVATCHAAGITVKMITGDHLGTAETIGRQLGLLSDGARGLEGAELARLDDARIRQVAQETNVFARVAPEHKLRLVQALQHEGHVVAMTGDGVNDAPALKQANVGVAMGITGTAVSKEAADMVLADDNFATIAAAVEEGRRIYDNLVKSLAFVLPTNLGLGFILIAAVAFFPMLTIDGARVPLMPILPTQLLWVNLVSAVALSLTLAFEVIEPDAMVRAPRKASEPILGGFVLGRTFVVALLMAAGATGLFAQEYFSQLAARGHEVALREAQTMAVTTVVFFQIFYLLVSRSLRTSMFRIGFLANPAVFVGIGLLLLLQLAFVYLPPMQSVFGTSALSVSAIARAAALGATILPVIGLEKALRARRAPGSGLALIDRPQRRGSLEGLAAVLSPEQPLGRVDPAVAGEQVRDDRDDHHVREHRRRRAARPP